MVKIGLFPLGIVLFPESSIPLHIFEERYKQLINDCKEKAMVFGINLVNPENMNEIGCTAKIEKILKKYPDGKLDVIITGVQRYRLVNFSEGEKPYYIGDVEYYDDVTTGYDYKLYIECVNLFNNLVGNITTIKIDKINPDALESDKPSFTIAQKSGLSIKQRQNLLELKSENERLQIILKHLKDLLPVVEETILMTQIIKNDGYFPPKNFS